MQTFSCEGERLCVQTFSCEGRGFAYRNMCSMLVSPAYVMVCGDGVRDMVRMDVHIR